MYNPYIMLYGLPYSIEVKTSTSSGLLLSTNQTFYKYKISKALPILKNSSSNLNASKSFMEFKKTLWYKDTMSKLIDSGALNRSMYVLAGMTFVVLIYFLCKAIKIKAGKTRVKKYGILHGGEIEFGDEDDWGDTWLRSSNIYGEKSKNNNKKNHVYAKTKFNSSKTSNGIKRSEYTLIGNTNKRWEMTPLDNFDPDMPPLSDDEGSDLDLFKATPPPVKKFTTAIKSDIKSYGGAESSKPSNTNNGMIKENTRTFDPPGQPPATLKISSTNTTNEKSGIGINMNASKPVNYKSTNITQ